MIATFLAVPDLNLFGTCVAPVPSSKPKRATAARRCAAQRSSRTDGRPSNHILRLKLAAALIFPRMTKRHRARESV